MKFVTNIDKNTYENFYNKSKYKNFLQSYEWGTFCKIGKKKETYYLGVVDSNNTLIAATMMIKTNLLFGFSYMYAPRGYIMDYNNLKLLNFFTIELKKYLKKNKIIFLTINPAIQYQELNNNAEIIKNNNNKYNLFKYLLKIGYKHKGFTKNYESNEPRYTFTINFQNKTFDEVYKGFNKSLRHNIKKAQEYGVSVKKGNENDIDIFYELIAKTALKDNFKQYNKEYYKNFYHIFNEANKAEIFISYIYPKKIVKKIQELKKHKNANLDKLNELEKKYVQETRNEIPVNAHIIVLDNNYATALYAGNDADYKETYANYLTYYTKIKYAYDKGCKELDLFGVTGDPKTKYKNLAGIFEFKKQFGGNLIEYIGDFDLIAYPILYKLLPILLKIYHKIKKS